MVDNQGLVYGKQAVERDDMSDNKDKQPDVGVVYVVTNPAMPGLVKIGSTKRDDVSL